MGMIWLQWRAELRDRWRTGVLLPLVVAVGGGVALTTLAGARRTDSAMGRFVAYSLPDDGGFLYGSVTSPPPASGPAASSLALPPVERRVAHLPQVAAYFRAPYLFLTTSRSGHNSASLNAIGDFDPALYRSVDRPLVVAGHMPGPTRPFEAAINEFAAEKGHLHVGRPVRLYAYSAAQFRNGGLTGNVAALRVPAGPSFMVRVTAIVRFPQDINAVLPLAAKADVSYEGQENLYLTPAF